MPLAQQVAGRFPSGQGSVVGPLGRVSVAGESGQAIRRPRASLTNSRVVEAPLHDGGKRRGSRPCDRSPSNRLAKPAGDSLFGNIRNAFPRRLFGFLPTRNRTRSSPPQTSACGTQYVPHSATRIIARMPALIGSGNVGQACMTMLNGGSSGPFSASTAPDFCAAFSRNPGFLAFWQSFDFHALPLFFSASAERDLRRLPKDILGRVDRKIQTLGCG